MVEASRWLIRVFSSFFLSFLNCAVVCIEPESDTDDIFKPSEPIPEPEVGPLLPSPSFLLVGAFLSSPLR